MCLQVSWATMEAGMTNLLHYCVIWQSWGFGLCVLVGCLAAASVFVLQDHWAAARGGSADVKISVLSIGGGLTGLKWSSARRGRLLLLGACALGAGSSWHLVSCLIAAIGQRDASGGGVEWGSGGYTHTVSPAEACVEHVAMVGVALYVVCVSLDACLQDTCCLLHAAPQLGVECKVVHCLLAKRRCFC